MKKNTEKMNPKRKPKTTKSKILQARFDLALFTDGSGKLRPQYYYHWFKQNSTFKHGYE